MCMKRLIIWSRRLCQLHALRTCGSTYKSTADSIQWIGLELKAASQGGPNDKTGKVEFQASYIQEGERAIHHELSRFRRSGGKWYYVDGRMTDVLA